MNTGRMQRGLVTLAACMTAIGWMGTIHAQPIPDNYDPRKNRGNEEHAAQAKQQADADRRRREAAEAKAADAESRAAELKRQLAEEKRKTEGAQKQAQKKVGAGDTAATPTMPPARKTPQSYAALTVFRDRLSDGTQGPEMIVIPAGSFEMGSNDEKYYGPLHTVRIAKAFALGKTEVTQTQWRQVMGSDPEALLFKGCDDCPVAGISWSDVQTFIRTLNALTRKTYRLPSEAEWEYAAKAGGNYRYSGGNDIDDVAWHSGNSGDTTHPVARKKPNDWGLHDMSGNVWEWVEDIWHDSYQGAPSDGSAWLAWGNAEVRVARGGEWLNPGRFYATSHFRFGSGVKARTSGGFRLARTLP